MPDDRFFYKHIFNLLSFNKKRQAYETTMLCVVACPYQLFTCWPICMFFYSSGVVGMSPVVLGPQAAQLYQPQM
jgi:hypothetical protein